MLTNCPQCNASVQPGALFCDNCGASLMQAAPAAQPPVAGAVPQPAVPAGMVACPQCGTPNVPGMAFCDSCGAAMAPQAPVPAAQAPVVPAPAAVPPVQPAPVALPVPPLPAAGPEAVVGNFVVVTTGAILAFPVGKTEVLVGREDPVSQIFPEIDLTPQDALNNGVGRRHALVTSQGGQVFVEDLNSVNHTSLNGTRLDPGKKYAIKDGDELVFGKLKMTYRAS